MGNVGDGVVDGVASDIGDGVVRDVGDVGDGVVSDEVRGVGDIGEGMKLRMASLKLATVSSGAAVGDGVVGGGAGNDET